MTAKLFSPEWCAQALVAENAASAEITSLFKDASAFTHVLAFEVSDRPDVVSHLRYEGGKCVAWTADLYPEDEVWARFSAQLVHWQNAAAASPVASKLVMIGKMKLSKGALKDAIANAKAFDRIVQCFSAVDTDWQV
jgi:hypothetical protein